jgi:hypothetical protein
VHTRRYPRYTIDRQVTAVVFWDDTPIRKVRGRCHVLGEGGMGASLADQLYVGEVVRLDMPPVHSLYATVRNTRGTDHGFEFLYTRDGQRKAVKIVCEMCADEDLS